MIDSKSLMTSYYLASASRATDSLDNETFFLEVGELDGHMKRGREVLGN